MAISWMAAAAAAAAINVDAIIAACMDARVTSHASARQRAQHALHLQVAEAQVNNLCILARGIFLCQAALLELEPRLKIFGDIHGH